MKKAIRGQKDRHDAGLHWKTAVVVPVTVIEAGPCTVVQKKTVETRRLRGRSGGLRRADGEPCQEAAEQARGQVTSRRLAWPPCATLREFRFDDCSGLRTWVDEHQGRPVSAAGRQALTSPAPARATASPAPFSAGTSTPAPWRTAPSTTVAWAPCSANSDPSRVFKNKHMAGHYGVAIA